MIPAGTYLVDPTANNHAVLCLGSRITLEMADGAVLNPIPTGTSNQVVVLISGVQTVTILGGTLLGNRDHNTVTGACEVGMGVEVAHSRIITLCNIVADNNRRSGMSIVCANGVVVRSSTFRNSHDPPSSRNVVTAAIGVGI